MIDSVKDKLECEDVRAGTQIEDYGDYHAF